jgi:hypothetical protein
MKLRHLIAYPCLLVGLVSMTAVAYLTWRNVVHGDGMILFPYLIVFLAGIPLVITWWKDLVATEWPVIVSYVLAAAAAVAGFALYLGATDHDNPWHVFLPEEARPQVPALTLEDYLNSKPPERPLWPRVTAGLFMVLLGPFISFFQKGCLFALRSLRRRAPENKNAPAVSK